MLINRFSQGVVVKVREDPRTEEYEEADIAVEPIIGLGESGSRNAAKGRKRNRRKLKCVVQVIKGETSGDCETTVIPISPRELKVLVLDGGRGYGKSSLVKSIVIRAKRKSGSRSRPRKGKPSVGPREEPVKHQFPSRIPRAPAKKVTGHKESINVR